MTLKAESINKVPLLEVKDLVTSFTLDQKTFHAVDGISYYLSSGEVLGFVGESGCGKSVTALSLMRLIDPPGQISGGRILFQGQDLLELPEPQIETVRGAKIGMIFQEPLTALNPVLTVGEQIAEVLIKHSHRKAPLGFPWLHSQRKEAQERTIEMLHLVGMPSPGDRAKSYPHQLSGGMRQRVMIAMALICHPQILIADEPTTALDVSIQAQILDLLISLQERMKLSVQFISHDLAVISEVSDRVIVMYRGQIFEEAPTSELFSSPRHPYTLALIESRPHFGQHLHRLPTIQGQVPGLRQQLPGCPFHNRCPRVLPECSLMRPPLLKIQSGHKVACFNPEPT